MSKRRIASVMVILCLAAAGITTAAQQSGPSQYQNPASEWLTWSLKDVGGGTINLTPNQGHDCTLILFRHGDSASMSALRMAAAYVRANPSKASNVIAMSIDQDSVKSIKLHLQQEEWQKRNAGFSSSQATSRANAAAAGLRFVPAQRPDYLSQLKSELSTANQLAPIAAYHFPFSTARRHQDAWEWIHERLSQPARLPRILKVDKDGNVLQQWTTVPTSASVFIP